MSIQIQRLFTSNDKPNWEDHFVWVTRSAEIKNDKGQTLFKMDNIEAPEDWSPTAINIVVSKYFYRGAGKEETSIKQMINRVVHTIAYWGLTEGYFSSDEASSIFANELGYMVAAQIFMFNSPVWFNVGTNGTDPVQTSACFILSLEDNMESILDLAKKEGIIFKYGSGAGTNLSSLRSSNEKLSNGGEASGVLSFMRGYDSFAGAIRSGGRTRRAAKMQILDVDHPDIIEFIEAKLKEEKKAHALIEKGYEGGMHGEAYRSVAFQNSNFSVQATDDFMHAVETNDEYNIYPVGAYSDTTKPMYTYKAKDILYKIAYNTHQCGDPGMQFSDTMNYWNTALTRERIRATNPCSELCWVDDSACNLASLNLIKLLTKDGHIDVNKAVYIIRLIIIAQDILVSNSTYPTSKVEQNALNYRNLGLGYTNLGSLLMRLGYAYDSDEGRNLAALITGLLTGEAYLTSTELAKEMGAFKYYKECKKSFQKVMTQHDNYLGQLTDSKELALQDIMGVWDSVLVNGEQYGYRNAQTTLLAPCGCLTKDALVLTAEGIIPIIDIGDGDGDQWQSIDIKVLQEDHLEQATKFFINGKDDAYEVKTTAGHSITGTWKHQLRVIDDNGNYIWKRMQDIQATDTVIMKLGGHEELLACKSYINLDSIGASKYMLPPTLDEDVAFILGYYMGDGYTKTKGGLHLCLDNKDKDLLDIFQAWAEKIHANLTIEDRGTYSVANIHGRDINRWWEINTFTKPKGTQGIGAAGAFIPDSILRSRTSVVCAFLSGLFEADGTISQQQNGTPTVEFSTVSKQLAAQMQVVLESLGIAASITPYTEHKNRLGKRVLYRVRVRNVSSAKIFKAKINFASKRKRSILDTANFSNEQNRNITLQAPAILQDLYSKSAGLPYDVRRDILPRKIQGRANYEWLKKIVGAHKEHLQDSKINQLLALGNVYPIEVASVNYIGKLPTYDISVPKQNTYIANGFISHNTIGFAMDCDTTGIEPDIALVKYKTLFDGGVIELTNDAIRPALHRLGYSEDSINSILTYIADNKKLDACPTIKDEHLSIFDCALKPENSNRVIHYKGHLNMMAAIQPLLSGAISKTVNLSKDATVEDIMNTYIEAWKLGLKAVAIYRDGSKAYQPISIKKDSSISTSSSPKPKRKRLPDERQAINHKFSIAGIEGYLNVGLFKDGSPGEVFINVAKEGSTISGLLDSFATSISIMLQYGIPLESLVTKFSSVRFEPQGITNNKEIRFASSIIDYIFRWLEIKFLNNKEIKKPTEIFNTEDAIVGEGDICPTCGAMTIRFGTCKYCPNCFDTSGCS